MVVEKHVTGWLHERGEKFVFLEISFLPEYTKKLKERCLSRRLSGDCLKRQCHANRWFLVAILCREKIRAATRESRGKPTFSWGKRFLLDSSQAVKLFAWLTELSWSDVSDTCSSIRAIFHSRKKAQHITEYRDTAPLSFESVSLITSLPCS